MILIQLLFVFIIIVCYRELPSIGSIIIKLYKEIYKKRERSVELIGKIEIPTIVLESGQVFEKW